MAARFSKQNAIDATRALAKDIREREGFTTRTGTAQLRSAGRNEDLNSAGRRREDELIRRAVEYGRAEAFTQFADWVQDGTLKFKESE